MVRDLHRTVKAQVGIENYLELVDIGVEEYLIHGMKVNNLTDIKNLIAYLTEKIHSSCNDEDIL